ncbi:hypothetical protein BD779DRAFT_1431020 [Infundibulicybe gibba]|nr:hypothetical protein BD779DRAFT_1431020 [Infundibulicybe gibba]
MIPSTTASISSRDTETWIDKIPALPDDPTHPIQIALRTYALSLSLSLGPALIPFVSSFATTKLRPQTRLSQLARILRRELGWDGFAFAITLSIGGGAAIRRFWESLKEAPSDPSIRNPSAMPPTSTPWTRLKSALHLLDLTPTQISLLSHVFSSSMGIFLLQAGRQRLLRLRQNSSTNVTLPFTPPVGRDQRTSPTLDLTLLLFVRAMDAAVQMLVSRKCKPSDVPNRDATHGMDAADKNLLGERIHDTRRKRQYVTSKIDAFIFWVCSARIMWCFFYEPQRLPRSYVTWIGTLANLDQRVIRALQLIRENRWSYISGSAADSELLSKYATELGHPASWGDPRILPSHGSASNPIWKSLGVSNRGSIGGLPCEIVHGQVGESLGLVGSCTANSGLRGLKAFMEAVAIYLPAHFIPILLTRPGSLLQPQRTLSTLISTLRSATFLSTFVASYWYTVCITRTLVFARLFPFISHDFWDGPYGCVLAGCLICGSSIWIENGRRRGEMALYVLPRAVRACLPDTWVKRGNRSFRILERIAFVLSISSLLTTGMHEPDALRGLSRWTISFIINGPSAGFWKRKRRNPSVLLTPSIPSTPIIPEKTMEATVLPVT